MKKIAPKRIIIAEPLPWLILVNIGYNAKLATDAQICGKQIQQLNNPMYVPSCFPSKAFVKIVNGIELIVTQPIPIKINATTDITLLWQNASIAKPPAAKTNPNE